jgi:hypothetical protein
MERSNEHSIKSEPVLEIIEGRVQANREVDSDELNFVGRAVAQAISESYMNYGSSSFRNVIREFVEFILNYAEIASHYQVVWIQFGGPQLLTAASQLSVDLCGEDGYHTLNACFTYMFMATHIPLPGEPGSSQFNEALAFIGLTDFVSTRAENLRRMLGVSPEARSDYEYTDGVFMRTFGHNWIIRCPSVTTTPDSRRAVFRNRLNRYISQRDPVNSNPISLVGIQRQSALKDSVKQLKRDPARIRRGVSRVRFSVLRENGSLVQESAFGDGVRTDWFSTVARQIFAPDNGLFENRGSLSMISPLSKVSSNEELRIFETIGRFIAPSLIQGVEIGALLPQAFIARLICQDITIDMIAEFDKQLANSIKYIRNLKDIESHMLRMPGSGSDDILTEKNRNKLIQAALKNFAVNGQTEQYKRLSESFREVLSPKKFQGFTPQDIQGFIYGESEIVIDENFLNLVSLAGYKDRDYEVVALREILMAYNQELRRGFVRFVSGRSQLPLGGFPAMKMQIARFKDPHSTGNPTASTCFSKLNLPAWNDHEAREDYKSRLEDRLTQGILALDDPNAGMSENAVNARPIVRLTTTTQLPVTESSTQPPVLVQDVGTNATADSVEQSHHPQ